MKSFLIIAALICLAASQAVQECPDGGVAFKCTLDEIPVCGVKTLKNGKQVKQTYINYCFACSVGNAEFTVEGRCEEFPARAKFCSPAESKAEVCTEEYNPQCGYFNNNIQCLVPPCAITGSNRCYACATENVLYTIKGECPHI